MFVANKQGVARVALSGSELGEFPGIPVINQLGQVAFRADHGRNGARLFLTTGTQVDAIASEQHDFVEMSYHPGLDDEGQVSFGAVTADGFGGIYMGSVDNSRLVVNCGSQFEAFRSAYVANDGRFLAVGVTAGGNMGLYTGVGDGIGRIIGIGDTLLGVPVVEMALNPVSVNAGLQAAIRVLLADARQAILLAEPCQ